MVKQLVLLDCTRFIEYGATHNMLKFYLLLLLLLLLFRCATVLRAHARSSLLIFFKSMLVCMFHCLPLFSFCVFFVAVGAVCNGERAREYNCSMFYNRAQTTTTLHMHNNICQIFVHGSFCLYLLLCVSLFLLLARCIQSNAVRLVSSYSNGA